MEKDYFVALGYWFVKNNDIFNYFIIVAAVFYLIIFLKLLRSRDGAFRLCLLLYFGASVLSTGALTFYHPYFNYWLLPITAIPKGIALFVLTSYILYEYWFEPRKINRRKPDDDRG